MSVKNLYTVKSIDSYECNDWLLYKHYAKRLCSISFCFGLFDDKKILIGICVFGVPASRALCVGICGYEYADKVIELKRLCVNENLQKNILSYFVSKCINMLPNKLILVSYADTSQGHHGYIYQATNWIYTGLSAKVNERYDENNPQKHSRTVTGNKKLIYNELKIRERPRKHRYITFTGTKKDKKNYKSKLKYKIENYPKGDNKNYDASYIPTIQTKLF